MKENKIKIAFIFTFLVMFLFCPVLTSGKNFVVVIDAGHGGHDPGAVGKISKEKNINLNVALKLGKIIERNCKDVKVIYTRKTDVFIPLGRRADIANNAKADLFISIHTNSLARNTVATGASTWTLGLAKSEANLDVAKRENSVILMEDDYQQRYAGFNPNSAESYIMFEFMQDKYMEQSVHLASLVQKQFKGHCRRVDRGVHQAGFLVLKASAMPSILVELGFISTPSEEKYLNTETGTTTLANGIYRAFLAYKSEQEQRLGEDNSSTLRLAQEVEAVEAEDTPVVMAENIPQPTPKPKPVTSNTKKANKTVANVPQIQTVETVAIDNKPVFKIQILVATKPLPKNDKQFKGVSPIDYYKEKGMIKYTYGESTDYNKIARMKKDISAKFKDAFIIAFKNGEKMEVHRAIEEFKKNK